MKVFYTVLFFLLLFTGGLSAQVSINTNNALPDSSAMLDISSTDKGVLIPRMTSAQRTAISNPATGLLVFDTVTNGFWFFNGADWIELRSGHIASLQDTDNDTKIQVEESADEDIIRFDVAGTESATLDRNGELRISRLQSNGFTTGSNVIQVRAAADTDQWLRFRRGGNPRGETGVIFSEFDNDHFFVNNIGDALTFSRSTENSATPDFANSTELMRLSANGNVGIGTSSPDASSALDITSTTQGLLPPRMTEAQRDAIQNPTPGLIIYCTDCMEMQMYNYSAWTNMVEPVASF